MGAREARGRRRLTTCLVSETEDIGIVVGLEDAHVVVLGALEDLCEGGDVHAERDGTVAAIALEAGRLETDRDEGNVRVVHRLEALQRSVSGARVEAEAKTNEALFVALKVGVGDELFDGWEEEGERQERREREEETDHRGDV